MNSTRSAFFVLVSLSILLTACGLLDSGAIVPTDLPSTATETASPVPPTATPEPSIVYLQLTDRAQPLAITPLADTIARLAQEDGLRFQQGPGDQPIPDLATIVITTGEAEQARQALQHPSQPIVIALGLQSIEANERLMVIGREGFRFDRAAFLAGYLGAMLTPDHRTGMISSSDNQNDTVWRQAYRAGQQYYCGLCRPAYPPFNDYPVVVSVPAEPANQDLATAIGQLVEQEVRSFYVPPIASASAALEAASTQNFIVFSTIGPTTESSNLVAIIRPAPEQALEEAWPEIRAGNTPSLTEIPIAIDRLDSEALNDARLRLAQEVLEDLNSGFIQPLGAN